MITWRIIKDNGIMKVRRGRTLLTEQFPDEAEALRYVNVQKAGDDRILRVADDGYETPVGRRHWRGRR